MFVRKVTARYVLFVYAGNVNKEAFMLWTVVVVLVVLWLLGFIGDFAGNLIHILLVIALIVLIYNLVAGRRAV